MSQCRWCGVIIVFEGCVNSICVKKTNKHGVSIAMLRQTGLRSLPETWMTPHELLIGWILSLCKTQEW